MDLQGKVALVTGASRGVGAAVAVALAQAGADVACAARATREQPLPIPGTIDDTVARIQKLGRRGLAVPTNLAKQEEVERMVQRTAEHFGRLDMLINNAAITFPGDLNLPLKRHDLIMEVNYRAPFLATLAAVPHMKARGEGAIINVSSAAAINVIPGLMTYGVSKIALERLTIDVAEQLKPFNIAVNCFRIDIGVASEGFVYNQPDADHDTWEPTDVAAEGVVWMLRQPSSYTGRLESMYVLRQREGIMKSRTKKPVAPNPNLRRFWLT